MDIAERTINKKVIIAIPCLLRGGTEQQTLLLIKALVESGYNVEVCCYFEYDDRMVASFKLTGAKVSLLKWPRDISTLRFIRSLAAIFHSKSPDMVHVQYIAPGFLPIIAAKFARVPVVLATVHYPGMPHGFRAHLFLRFSALLTDCFTCVSQAAEKSWFGNSFLYTPPNSKKEISRKHLTILNAVDIDAIDKVLAENIQDILVVARKLEGKTIIGTIARLSSEKGVDVLLKAFAAVRKMVPDVHLLIVGDGMQKNNLLKLATDLGISDTCTWMGKLPWNEAMGCLKLMNIVVVPSRFEGFGLTAIEAMACKKPVVASNIDGLAEIIQDGKNGFLASEEDANSFGDYIVALAKDKEKRKSVGEAARQCIEEKYAYPHFRERIKALYQAFRLKAEGRRLKN